MDGDAIVLLPLEKQLPPLTLADFELVQPSLPSDQVLSSMRHCPACPEAGQVLVSVNDPDCFSLEDAK